MKKKKIKFEKLIKLLPWWPPLIGTGIQTKLLDNSLLSVESSMSLRPWNRNFLGTHFGGSLYTMCDPFFVLILIYRLGDEYIVWDKEASINYLNPGKGKVRAVFEVSREQEGIIKAEVEELGKATPEFIVEIKDENENIVAYVKKILSIRKKRKNV